MADDSKADVWAIVADQRIAMLTVEEDGKLTSRPMGSIARPEENRIYFVTRLDSKVGEIGGSAPVNLGYSDTHKNTYLSISGTARTSQDRDKLRELWSMWVEAWLPQGPDGEDVALITIEPEDAKLWDSTSSNLIYTGKVLKAVATQSPPDGGRIEEVDMGGTGQGFIGSGTRSAPDARTAGAYDKAMRQDSDELEAPSMGGPTA
ncbi:pyridoxamine 5'-phosphate oxidase family protein [Sphingosinicella sp. BN140058]|uniref:pyridoxamine 5'-phosphate oxidase family protein n=1 Tax=Sphingosinicella sp. BN140058 TaxID=1892855 RepID=UPI0010115A76|nr:pyridoxamine 5'-phosphate oxidase family protein [Sphingosinicella sp. BN140058]QAY77826.1 pyridoxamine 5'-phosphate oxidase [Sphingosinicella sp. BN140058]